MKTKISKRNFETGFGMVRMKSREREKNLLLFSYVKMEFELD